MNPTRPTQRVSRKPKTKPLDKAVLGVVAGLVFGALGLLIVYYFLYRSRGWDFYVEMLTKGVPTFTYAAKSISLAMIFNLIPFYYFLNKKYYQGTKGVIIATGLLGLLFIMYKFVW